MQPADAADPMDPRKLRFAFESAKDRPAIRYVAKRHADAVAERKRAHLVVAIGPQAEKLSNACRERSHITRR